MKLDKAIRRDRKLEKRQYGMRSFVVARPTAIQSAILKRAFQSKSNKKGEKAMSHKTKAAGATAAQSCASRCAYYYGDNSTNSLTIQEGGEKK